MKRRSFVFMILSVFLCALVAASCPVNAKRPSTQNPPAAPADPVIGHWYTEGQEGGVELYSCDTYICGRFYWLRQDQENGDASRDTHNPDVDKRGRPLCGLTFITGFVPNGNGKYTDGTIYNPRLGVDFSSEMTLADHDTLNLRGYVGTPLLGHTQTWKRDESMSKCRMPDAAATGKPAGE